MQREDHYKQNITLLLMQREDHYKQNITLLLMQWEDKITNFKCRRQASLFHFSAGMLYSLEVVDSTTIQPYNIERDD